MLSGPTFPVVPTSQPELFTPATFKLTPADWLSRLTTTEKRLHLLERSRLLHVISWNRSSVVRGNGRNGKDMCFLRQHTTFFPMSIAIMRRTRSFLGEFGIVIFS